MRPGGLTSPRSLCRIRVKQLVKKAMFQQLREHVHRLLTRPTAELSRAQRTLRYMINLAVHCARELSHDRAEEMAAALTYRTIFSLVPLFVIGLVVFRLFGGFENLESHLQEAVYDFLGVPEVAYKDAAQAGNGEVRASIQKALTELTNKVADLDFASIGGVGVVLFIYAALALAFSVEYDFNVVFKSPRGRPWHLRIAIYWAVITLGSSLLALSLYLSGRFVAWIGALGVFEALLFLLNHLFAFLASWVLLFLLYSLMPNTHVEWKPTLIGSFVAALLWECGKGGFQVYVNRALPYSAFYGSLGLIPLFLFWIYVSWLIVLFGLELAYTLQVMHGKLPSPVEDRPPLTGDPEWFIPTLAEIGRAFGQGKTIGRQELAEHLDLPSRVVNEFAETLEKAGLIHVLYRRNEPRYTLARPPESIRVTDLLQLGRQVSRNPSLAGNDKPAWNYLEELNRVQCEAAAGVTLDHLIAGKTPSTDNSRRQPNTHQGAQ